MFHLIPHINQDYIDVEIKIKQDKYKLEDGHYTSRSWSNKHISSSQLDSECLIWIRNLLRETNSFCVS